jgi:squalene-hopene/tetraprenyl-beta-curcumene cyclase
MGALLAGVLTAFSARLYAANPPTATPAQIKAFQTVADKAIGYLQKSQNEDGSYGAQKMPAITAINTTALLRIGRPTNDPLVAKGLKFLESNIHDDGGIYGPKSRLQNYETCAAVVCLAAANSDGKYTKILKQADEFLKKIQDGGVDEANVGYGGVGYDGKSRPDLSNTSMFMDAMQAAGTGPDDPHVKAALVFISRCQNLESEHNTTPFAAKFNDGGFYYSPASTKEADANGGLRSYGSMSYAGLKSMLFAGLGPDDKRVKAATEWIKKNYDLKSNPGMGSAGLYYYYLTYAKALEALGQPEFTDAKGVKHNWRKELVAELASRQKPDGSWVNDNRQWLENDASVASGIALLALSYCKPQTAANKAAPQADAKTKTSFSTPAAGAKPVAAGSSAEFKKEAAAFRKALAKRDLKGAKQLLAELEKSAQSDADQDAYSRLDLYDQYYEGFWVAIGNVARSLKPTDEIVLGNARAIVVDAEPTSMTLRVDGQSRRFTIENMPNNLALAIANQWFDKSAKNKLFIGAFMAAEGAVADAKKIWQEAGRAGVDVQSLVALADTELTDK